MGGTPPCWLRRRWGTGLVVRKRACQACDDALHKLLFSHVCQVLSETRRLMELEHLLFVALLPKALRAARAAASRPWCVVPVAFSNRSSVYLATRAMPESTWAFCIMVLPCSRRRTSRAASSMEATWMTQAPRRTTVEQLGDARGRGAMQQRWGGLGFSPSPKKEEEPGCRSTHSPTKP